MAAAAHLLGQHLEEGLIGVYPRQHFLGQPAARQATQAAHMTCPSSNSEQSSRWWLLKLSFPDEHAWACMSCQHTSSARRASPSQHLLTSIEAGAVGLRALGQHHLLGPC